MGRSRSRRGRGKSGGQGSGGSGKGKGKGGSRGRSSGTRGGAGKGGSGSGKGKGTGGSRGRSNNTRGGQSKANRNQNKKARNTVKSVSKAIGKATRGAAANAASAIANSSLASKYNRKTRDMSKLTPQSRRRYERLSQKTGRDYSKRDPSMRINLSADRLAQFAGVADSGWYKGLTSRFPGIRKLQINKQLYSNPQKKGWHSSQRTGRGQGVKNIEASTRDQLQSLRSETPGYVGHSLEGDDLTGVNFGGTNNWLDFYRPENQKRLQDDRFQMRTADFQDSNGDGIDDRDQYTTGQPRQLPRDKMGPEPDRIAMMYENILGRKADQEGLDYWKNELSSGQSLEDIRRNFVRSEEFQGRSDADKSAALHGIKKRRAARGEKVGVSRIAAELDRRGIRHSKTGSPPRKRRGRGNFGTGAFGGGLAAAGIGLATRNWKGKGRARPTGKKPTGRGLLPSIAAVMAARGGI